MSPLKPVWHVLTRREPFQNLGADYWDARRNPAAETRRLLRRLEALGHRVTLEPAA
jgi:transposase